MLLVRLVYEKHMADSRGERVEGDGVALGTDHWVCTVKGFVC